MHSSDDQITLVFETEDEWMRFLELCKQERELREKAQESQLQLIEK